MASYRALMSSYGGQNQNLPQTLSLDHVSPATRLLEKRRQMFEVQEALDAQKEEFARREDAFRRREEQLRRKDIELQESLIKFNKFLQENESKKNRAEKRKADESRQRDQKEQEIIKLRIQLEEKEKEAAELKSMVSANSQYQHYLNAVVEHATKDYPEIQDLLNRYRTLIQANSDLNKRKEEHEAENELKRVEFNSYTKERNNETLNMTNDIAFLQKQSENAHMHVLRLQNEADLAIRGLSDKTLELGQILRSIDNILERCESGQHGKLAKFAKAERPNIANFGVDIAAASTRAIEKLDDIAMDMMDYRDIVEEFIRKRGGNAADSNEFTARGERPKVLVREAENTTG